nr:MAG TPA: hypothetical protein [Caudoviricetes sp.]
MPLRLQIFNKHNPLFRTNQLSVHPLNTWF